MYVLYKLAQIPLRPEVWILTLIAVAAWKRSRPMAIAAAVLFYALSTRPLRDLFVAPLENAPVPNAERARGFEPRAVVVLGGGAAVDPATRSPTIYGTKTLDRTVCGIALARAFASTSGELTLVLSGGAADPYGHAPEESPAMRMVALSLGFPEDRIVVDDRSRNTAENAARVRELLSEGDRILLATSAIHLPRATRRFRAAGLLPLGAPCDRIVTKKRWDPNDFIPRAYRLQHVSEAIHEWIGLALGR